MPRKGYSQDHKAPLLDQASSHVEEPRICQTDVETGAELGRACGGQTWEDRSEMFDQIVGKNDDGVHVPWWRVIFINGEEFSTTSIFW